MRSADDIKTTICNLYSELGKDPNELRHFSVKDFTYYITRTDGAITSIRRKDIDDYFDSKDNIAKINIINALNNFQQK
jgi:hypothetical protein